MGYSLHFLAFLKFGFSQHAGMVAGIPVGWARYLKVLKHFGTFCLIVLVAGCSSTGAKPDPVGAGSGNGANGVSGFFQKLQGGPPPANNNTPAPLPAKTSSAGSGNGILAGQIMDYYHRRPGGATIQVVDLQNTGSNAVKNEVASDSQGYFTIHGLKPGVNYQLIARGREGDKVFSGTALVVPPNPRITIFVSLDANGEAGSSPARDPGADGKSAPAQDKARTAEATSPQDQSTNTTSLPQIDKITRENPTNSPGAILSIPSVGGGQGGYPVPPTPNLPAIGNIIPIKPGLNNPSLSGIGYPNVSQSFTPVPSCVLVGQKLENFSLNDMNGQVWEYKKNKVGRMVLVDFWFSSCGPCLQAIPHVVELQKRYKSFGLEVVGIAYEKGDITEKVQKVRPVRARYHMNYLTLFGGDGPEPCPVRTQFDVTSFPCLVLLDEDGNIVWRNQKDEGIDQRQLGELELEIRRGLGIRSK